MDYTYKVLFLTNNNNTAPLIEWLQKKVKVIIYEERITLDIIKKINPDLVVSFNYKYIIKKDIIEYLGKKIINMHISFLPWNKGSNPNFWSFFDNTPKGVTIHEMDIGLDTGNIIFQKKVIFEAENETFISSYNRLMEEIIELFKENWEVIKKKKWKSVPQDGKGTYHTLKDFIEIKNKYEFTWQDNIANYLFNCSQIIELEKKEEKSE